MRSTRSSIALLVLASAAVLAAGEGARLRPQPPLLGDGAGGTLARPEGVGCSRGPLLLVADTAHERLVRYALDAGAPRADAVIPLPSGFHPLRAQALSSGDIVALDAGSRRIARLGANGDLAGWVDLQAAGAKGPALPQSLRVGADDRLYVLDARGARVLVLDAAGRVAREIAYPEPYGFLMDLAIDAHGRVLAVDAVARRVLAAAPDATALAPLGPGLAEDVEFPTAIEVDDRGRIFVVDRNGGGIVVLGPDGSFRGRQSARGWKEGTLRSPAHLCIHESRTLFVADRDNQRVQPFTIAD